LWRDNGTEKIGDGKPANGANPDLGEHPKTASLDHLTDDASPSHLAESRLKKGG